MSVTDNKWDQCYIRYDISYAIRYDTRYVTE